MTNILENIDGGKMIWSVGEWNNSTMEFHPNYDALTTDGELLTDGVHHLKVLYDNVMTTATVVVADGKFADSTINIIGTAANASGYWGPFIEGFKRTEHGIEVIIGS